MDIVMEAPAKNALGTDLLTWLRDQIRSAGTEPLFLTGAGDAFSAGLNLQEISQADETALLGFLELLNDVTLGLFRHPAPTVAAINGHAIAGGALIARACDHAVATTNPKTKIGLNETALGLVFPPRLFDLVRFRVPRASHVEVLLLGRLFDPQGALRVGLVDELADDVTSVARARFEALSANAGPAYAGNKALLQGSVGLAQPERDERFVAEVLSTWTSPEFKARLRAVLGR